MMWLFAVLIVLVLGGVAVLAAGRGTPMAEVYDDRPDATVPADGPLSATDLRSVRFSLALRGYRMSEVDALLDRLAREREATAAETAPDAAADPGRGDDHTP
jgi:DivIVA domain-containing protein